MNINPRYFIKQQPAWIYRLFKYCLLYAVFLVISLAILFPFYWILITSFKENIDFYGNLWSLPNKWIFVNYQKAWQIGHINQYFLNSLIVTAASIFLTLLLSTTCAYGLARLKIKSGKYIQLLFVITMSIPFIFYYIPQLIMVKRLMLYDSLFGLILIYAVGAQPFAQFLLFSFFKNIPAEYEESAMIDGASYFRIFSRIMLPIAQPAIVTLVIFHFIEFWNEYFQALILLKSRVNYTIPLGVANIIIHARYRTDWGVLMSSNIILIIPSLLFYFIFRKKIQGLTVSGIKG